ncbi:MAG: tRNA (adenosine(37)-N6)-dimethylallyltransferase MiaA [Lachnospiraceae bacterium]|nr:tRNA (adenosine(37)-N6)-dimethylallyltransferase MiaA [Lachnospiraceae bacterium]
MTESSKKKLVIVAGPTAVGKSGAAVALAREIGGEIISADSMQVYRGMDVGSAKIREEEMQGIPHHLIDVLDPAEEFNVTVFKELALRAMEEICANGHIPIVAGGTGFYIRALLYDTAFTENDTDKTYRNELMALGKEKGAAYLHGMLRELDPASADAIHENNMKRVIRALEFYHDTGTPISAHNEEERKKPSPYDFRYFVMTMDRAKLYARIDARVDKMMEDGLLSEVTALRNSGIPRSAVSMQGLGYKQLLAYLEGETTLDEAVSAIKQETRHFAKRQLTWFRREPDAIWVDTEKESLLDVYNAWHFT